MLSALQRWRDHRRAVQVAANKLIEEYGQEAFAEARRRQWHPDIPKDEWMFNLDVRNAGARRLGIDWCPDTATRYVEGTIGGLWFARRE